MSKHFSGGRVVGRMIEEPEIQESKGGKKYLSFKISVAGQKCGSVSAFCRMWTPERFEPFIDAWKDNKSRPFFLKGFFSQYKTDKNEWFSTFTITDWQQRESSDPYAAFTVIGDVDQVQPMTNGYQRIFLKMQRDGQEEELFEIFLPSEFLLSEGETVKLTGYVRQLVTEDDFGESSGPIHAYASKFEVLAPF